MVYKSLHGLTPDYLCSKFEKQETEYIYSVNVIQLMNNCPMHVQIKIILSYSSLGGKYSSCLNVYLGFKYIYCR